MNNSVSVSKAFIKDAKTLLKKYHTLKQSINTLIENLIENPYLGVPYGDKLFKVRLADKSKGSGKSGGFRVMYYHLIKTEAGIEILLLTIFDKSEKSSISKADAIKKLANVLKDL
ncbi:type II toxin-antitoxin system RelE/ParE family toxin [Mucilaginibacter psychrotolerans]|uniref:Addiction module toxin RelE n=1 Tax=Mucilaginibacter psychrotolerans TaxID=1524096 RepID=A0A4Y8S8V7_9SPHI|nr:type II toxin-antitoxin system RelE/ParE family toxin [Mucilaginibacter psychrotolerans]TFF35045.1 addiction module toxin RelE [Mucilaginibacter psychrotolerans]